MNGWMEWHESIDSTQTRALRLAEEGAPHGTAVIAKEQTAGRGRQGRTWHSPSGKGLYISWILRPQCPVHQLPWLPLVTGAAVAEAVRNLPEANRLHLLLKWPNDLYAASGKIGGILIDAKVSSRKCVYAVAGLGLSLQHREDDVPSADRARTSSWFREGVESPDPLTLANAVQVKLLEVLERLFSAQGASATELRRYVKTMMPRVQVEWLFRTPEGILPAIPLDLDESMRLLIEFRDGRRIWLEPKDADPLASLL